MYRIFRESTDNMIGVIFEGDVESRDFDTLLPFLAHAIRKESSLRILLDLQDVTSTDLLSIMKVVLFDLKYSSALEKQALVTDNQSLINLASCLSFLTRKQIRSFPTCDSEQAWEWIEK